LACAVPDSAVADDSLERDPTRAWGPCLKCLQPQDQRAQNWDNWVCVCWGGSSRGSGGRDEGERGAVDVREEEIFVVSGLGAQQEGLCATLTRGWPVDRRMEMEMEME
jgi:hypothetical protein